MGHLLHQFEILSSINYLSPHSYLIIHKIFAHFYVRKRNKMLNTKKCPHATHLLPLNFNCLTILYVTTSVIVYYRSITQTDWRFISLPSTTWPTTFYMSYINKSSLFIFFRRNYSCHTYRHTAIHHSRIEKIHFQCNQSKSLYVQYAFMCNYVFYELYI